MLDSLLDMLADLLGDATVAGDPLGPLSDSVTRVSEDMGVPAPAVFADPGSWGENVPNDPTTILDDEIGADPKVIDSINAKYGDRAYDAITAHEMTHAKIGASGLREDLTPRCEEALCDAGAGFYAGEHGLPRDVYDGEIGSSIGDVEHPVGAERCAIFNRAYDIAMNGSNPADMESLVGDVVDNYNCA